MGTRATFKTRPYVRATDTTWTRMRADYRAGVAVELLAAHYGPSRTEIYRHVRDEGWTRAERPTPARLRSDAADAPGEGGAADAGGAVHDPTLEGAVARTVAAAVQAVHDDRASEAMALATLAERLLRLKARTAPAEAEAAFTPARDIIAVLAERFGVEPVP